MAEFKNSKTCQNLLKAFAGESQARNRYTFAASVAKKQGFLQISNIFLETAENEKEHAKLFMKQLIANGMEGEAIEIEAAYPAAYSQDTLKNLEYAANGEKEEWDELYPEFAKIAEEEGYKEAASTFKLIALVEKAHEARYRKLWENVKNATVFKKDGKVFWKCINCGHVMESIEAPELCPVCKHGKKYFEVHCENY
jgi:rubrerythrin